MALGAALAAAGLVLAGCGDGPTARVAATSPTPTTSAAPSSSSAAPESSVAPTESASASASTRAAGKGRVVTSAASEFGPMLFNRAGQAIYLFDREATRRAECYGPCAKAWPPVLTEGAPRASGDVRAALLGTTERDDGSTQVTYAGHPLYYYVDDGPNQVLCHNVREFGGLWLVVTPEGEPAAA